MSWGRLSLWKWVPGISSGVKAAGAFGWRPTTLVVPKVEKIRGLNLPGTPRATSACRGIPSLLILHWVTTQKNAVLFLFVACFTVSTSGTVGLKHCATRREVWLSIPGRVRWNLKVAYSYCPHSVALGSTQLPKEMSTKSSLEVKERPSSGVYSCAVPIVPNVKVRMEAQHSIPHLSLNNLWRQSFTFYNCYKNCHLFSCSTKVTWWSLLGV